ncbi:MAG: DUF4124 domain-containing protein [Candidatus Competibacterales bacterium]
MCNNLMLYLWGGFAALIFHDPSHGQTIYRWVDAAGTVHFSSVPPPDHLARGSKPYWVNLPQGAGPDKASAAKAIRARVAAMEGAIELLHSSSRDRGGGKSPSNPRPRLGYHQRERLEYLRRAEGRVRRSRVLNDERKRKRLQEVRREIEALEGQASR